MKILSCALLALATLTPTAFASVAVSSPSNGATLGSNVQFVASGSTTTCSKGVASMGVYVDNSLAYTGNGASLNTNLSLGTGSHRTVVQEWDFCGGATSAVVNIKVNKQSGVAISSPANGASVSSSVPLVASGTSGCNKGVASMGVYVNNQLVYTVGGSQINTSINIGSGSQSIVVVAWDYCGGATTSQVTVNGSASVGTTMNNLQASGGWNQWGELAPTYDICSPCSGVNWSMSQHVSKNSLSGNATQFNIGGSTPYSDVLWSNPIIGQGTTQGLPDTGRTLMPNLHNFIYDAQFYITKLSVTQDLEFDINMYLNGVGMEWGTECNHLADGVWDIWDNVDAKWIPTSVPCQLNDNAWNHVVVQVQREANNDLLYQTITVNGVTHTINQTVAPFSVPSGWYGMTLNYQMDGNYKQASNTTYMDNFKFTYW